MPGHRGHGGREGHRLVVAVGQSERMLTSTVVTVIRTVVVSPVGFDSGSRLMVGTGTVFQTCSVELL